MKRLLYAALTLALCAPLFAKDVDPKVERAVREALPVCADAKIHYDDLPVPLPPRFTGMLVRVESESHACDGQYGAVISPTGGFFLGSPWPIANDEGATIEQKLKNFGWRAMQETMEATVDRTPTSDGLLKVTLWQTTENGKMPLEGEVDPAGKVFFFGHFRPAGTDMRAARLKTFEPYIAQSPSRGAAKPSVTIIEFSDFQCPSCQRAAHYVDPIVEKHPDAVRYVRYDLPLAMHSWAFGASMVGRAIARQKPELFWDYKQQVYANQSSMNAFMFWDWARGWAEDHDLDMKKYDADLQSEELKTLLLKGAGVALSNEIRATPTYLVNGTLVETGTDGKDLAAYVDKLLAK